jgi:putative hydrolase of the HAD superfamily
MPQALLLDLDGVVRHWDPERDALIEREHGLPTGSIAAAAFADPTSLNKVVTGTITDDTWRKGIAARLESQHGPAARAAVAQWSQAAGQVDADVLHLVRMVRLVIPTALVTNATTRLDDDLAALGLHGEFDEVVNSAQVGHAKPEREVFLLTCSRLRVQPAECLFVDDTAANLEGAAALGMRTHEFRSVDRLRDFLDDAGALPAS